MKTDWERMLTTYGSAVVVVVFAVRALFVFQGVMQRRYEGLTTGYDKDVESLRDQLETERAEHWEEMSLVKAQHKQEVQDLRNELMLIRRELREIKGEKT